MQSVNDQISVYIHSILPKTRKEKRYFLRSTNNLKFNSLYHYYFYLLLATFFRMFFRYYQRYAEKKDTTLLY